MNAGCRSVATGPRRPSQRLRRLPLAPEHPVGAGQALVRGAEQQDRELVTRREHELQVGDHLVRPRDIRGAAPSRTGLRREQLREGKAAEVLRQTRLDGRGLVQLGHRSGGHGRRGPEEAG